LEGIQGRSFKASHCQKGILLQFLAWPERERERERGRGIGVDDGASARSQSDDDTAGALLDIPIRVSCCGGGGSGANMCVECGDVYGPPFVGGPAGVAILEFI